MLRSLTPLFLAVLLAAACESAPAGSQEITPDGFEQRATDPPVQEPDLSEPTLGEPAPDEPNFEEPNLGEPTLGAPAPGEGTTGEGRQSDPAVAPPVVVPSSPDQAQPTLDQPAPEIPPQIRQRANRRSQRQRLLPHTLLRRRRLSHSPVSRNRRRLLRPSMERRRSRSSQVRSLVRMRCPVPSRSG